eukprot:4036029-Prymnesium_polylepis.1
MRLGTPLGRSTDWRAGARERAAHVERACTHLPLQMRTKAVRDSTTRARSGPSSRCSGLYTTTRVHTQVSSAVYLLEGLTPGLAFE